MKIATIIGSPHGMKGNTGKLLAKAIEAIEKAGAEVKTFSLTALTVQPCRACDTCHKTGKCAIRDDFEPIKNALLEADGVVLASPNYIFNVTAQMKALLDRCCGPLHCQDIEGKYAAAVVTSGGSGGEEVADYMTRFLRAMGYWTVGSVAAEAWRLSDETARLQIFDQASELGRRLAEAISRKEVFTEQRKERDAFYSRMKALMTARKDAWPFEYEYWRSRGRL